AVISPNTEHLKTQLLQQLPALGAIQGAMTLSFYLHASQHDLRQIFIAATVFIVVLNVYRTPQRIKRLLATIACVGGAVALLALAQDITRTRSIYWRI